MSDLSALIARVESAQCEACMGMGYICHFSWGETCKACNGTGKKDGDAALRARQGDKNG